MPITTGVVLFDDVEELDFAGPWEVLGAARQDGDRLLAVAHTLESVRDVHGLRMSADVTFDECPELDVIVVPGGPGTRRDRGNEALVEWLAKAGPQATWLTSVCTGAYLLDAADVIGGRRITTHWAFVDKLRERGLDVVSGDRWVVDGNLVTAAGVSAGIDMALWLVGQVYGEDHARRVMRAIEYDPAPPY